MRFLLLFCLLFAGCVSVSSPPVASTAGPVVNFSELERHFGAVSAGDSDYAVVSSQWMLDFYPEFRADLFRRGVTKADVRFDCNHFSGYYVELAQIKFYADNFQSRTKAQALALGVWWYVPDRRPNTARSSHAVVAALTEQGVKFFEPQTGKFVTLSSDEVLSTFVKIF